MSDADLPTDASGPDADSPAYWTRIEEILDALSAVGPDRLEAEILALCGGDASLEDEVRSLLAHLPDPEDDDGETARLDLETLDPDTLVGRDLGGFVIESVVGVGGHGIVYRAMQDRPRRAVAVKVVQSPSLRFARARTAILTRFEREVEALAAVDHPAVARILAAGIDAATGRPLPFLVAEFVEGARDLVTWWGETDDFATRLAVLIEIADAVQAAHGVGILHRDLKPANVLIDGQGRPKIIDFGIAGVLDARRRVRDDLRGGSVSFTSPEQMSGDDEVTVRSDVFALGRLLAACLATRPPARSMHAMERRAAVDLHAIAASAAAATVGDRYPTAAAFSEELRRVADGRPAEAANPGRWRSFQASMRRHPVVTGIVGAACVIVLAMLVVSLASWRVAVRAERLLAIENDRLEAALPSEAASLRRERLTIASLAEDTPIIARRALDAIGPEHDDLAERLLRHRFADGGDALVGKGINSYRIRGLPDGRVLTSSGDRTVRVFDRGEASPVHVFDDLPEQVFGVASSLDGRSLVAVTSAGTVHHWTFDVDGSVRDARQVLDDRSTIVGLAHHPAEPIIAFGDSNGRGRMIDLATDPPTELVSIDGVDTRWSDADFSPDGRRLVFSGLKSGVVLLERDATGGWTEVGRRTPRGLVRTVRFSPDGGRLAVAGGSEVTVFDVDGLRTRVVGERLASSLFGLAWSPSGERLVIGGWGQELIIFDAATLEPERTLLGSESPIWSIAWVGDDLIATGEEDAAIRWWPIADGESRSWKVTHPVVGMVGVEANDTIVADDHGGVHRLRCDGSVDTLVAPGEAICRSIVTSNGFARLVADRLSWHALDGSIRAEHTLPWSSVTVDQLVPSTDARWIGAVLDGVRVAIIETETGRVVFEAPIERDYSGRCWWDGEGRFVVPMSLAGRDDSFASERRIDPETGTESGPPSPTGRNIRASIDVPGAWICAMATDDEFTVFPSSGAERIQRDQAHSGGVNAFAIADDGRTLITGGTDGQVRLWSMPGAEPLLTLRSRPGSSVRCLEVVEDRRLLVGHADGTVFRYEAIPASR